MDKNNIIIAFTLKAETSLLNILKKYKIEESDEEWMEKLKAKKTFNMATIAGLCRNFFLNEISEKVFINSLQKELNVNNETAKNIFEDATKDIIPYLVKTTENDIENGNIPKNTENNQSIMAQDEMNTNKTKNKLEGINILSPMPKNIDKPIIPSKKTSEIKKQIIKPQKQKTTDAYREKIE